MIYNYIIEHNIIIKQNILKQYVIQMCINLIKRQQRLLHYYENISQINAVLLNFLFIRAADQHIRLISEGSCDTEDWSNDAENTAFHHRNKLHFKTY